MYRRLGICRLITQILSQFIKFNIALKFRLSIIKLPLYTAIIYRDPVKKNEETDRIQCYKFGFILERTQKCVGYVYLILNCLSSHLSDKNTLIDVHNSILFIYCVFVNR